MEAISQLMKGDILWGKTRLYELEFCVELCVIAE